MRQAVGRALYRWLPWTPGGVGRWRSLAHLYKGPVNRLLRERNPNHDSGVLCLLPPFHYHPPGEPPSHSPGKSCSLYPSWVAQCLAHCCCMGSRASCPVRSLLVGDPSPGSQRIQWLHSPPKGQREGSRRDGINIRAEGWQRPFWFRPCYPAHGHPEENTPNSSSPLHI